jgi:pyruvate kinase
MKKTKIICSIGPSSCNVETMVKMVESGMDVARINFSHATEEEKENVVSTVKKVRKITGKNIAILYDTKGPEFRNGNLENGSIELVEGALIRIVKEKVLGNSTMFSVNHKEAIDSINVGNIILLENGLMKLEVVSKESDGITCKVITPGILGNKKSLSVPKVKLDIPFISKEDREDIIYAIKHDADFIALSFVSSKEDVCDVRKILREYNSNIKIISKIESVTGIDNLDDIISVSDGIMVARGDLGVEVPMEDLPYYQQLIINKCRQNGKIAIVATEMLESMKKNIRPTRAEVTDISYAVATGADAVMLSGETTTGKNPIEAVKYMAKVCESTEKHIEYVVDSSWVSKDIKGSIASSVVNSANLLSAKMIIVATMTGKTASVISNLRSKSIIIANCISESVARSLALNWGVYTNITTIHNTTDEIVDDAINYAINSKDISKDDIVIITGGFPQNKDTNFMKIEKI